MADEKNITPTVVINTEKEIEKVAEPIKEIPKELWTGLTTRGYFKTPKK